MFLIREVTLQNIDFFKNTTSEGLKLPSPVDKFVQSPNLTVQYSALQALQKYSQPSHCYVVFSPRGLQPWLVDLRPTNQNQSTELLPCALKHNLIMSRLCWLSDI